MLTLTSTLSRTIRLYADRPAIVDPEGTFSWEQFGRRIAQSAGVLMQLGIERGDRYGVICRNVYRNAEVMHAGYWIGAIPVPINFRLAPPEIAYILDDAECRLLVVEDLFTDLLETEELAPWADRDLRVGPEVDGTSRSYDSLLAATAPSPCYDQVGEDDDALIVYTGGTTGRPKGVRLSHRNIVANAMQIGLAVVPRRDDVFLHVAPMFHSADLLADTYTLVGAAHLFLPKFSSRAVFEAIETFGVTSTMLTPTMIVLMLQDPDIDRFDTSSLRQVIYGSSPMAAEWIRKALEHFQDVEFIQAYGLTETAPLLTILGMEEHEKAITAGAKELLNSVGRPLVGVDMKILDDAGNEVGNGLAGEVVVRGPNVCKGYLKQAEATAEAFRDGWFFTGDVGHVDERGHLYLLDRKKDMIITGGENVYSLEVEAVLSQNSKVYECAVVGVPDEVYGEAILAAIVTAPGESITGEELIEHCRGKIGGYKIPRRYVFLEQLPKSAMNKVLKNELRRRYGSESTEKPS